MICPFCRVTAAGGYTGQTTCPACKAGFEIDDRGECVFVDMASPRMPMHGQVCTACGLVQLDKRTTCVYCGTRFNRTLH